MYQIHGLIPLSAGRFARERNAAEELEPIDFCSAAKDHGMLGQRLPADAREQVVAAKEGAASDQPGDLLCAVRIGQSKIAARIGRRKLVPLPILDEGSQQQSCHLPSPRFLAGDLHELHLRWVHRDKIVLE